MLLMYNQIRFDVNEFKEETIVPESYLQYLPINTQFQSTTVYKIQKAEIELQDLFVDADSITELTDDSIFTLSRMPDRSYEKDYDA